jgi:orotate phosphoribosyltransferase-like protein
MKISKKKLEMMERQKKILELLFFGLTEIQIATLLEVSRETIVRDVAELKDLGNKWTDDLPRGILALFQRAAVIRIQKRLNKIDEKLENTQNAIEMTKLIAEARENEKLCWGILGDGAAVHSLQRAMGDVNAEAA